MPKQKPDWTRMAEAARQRRAELRLTQDQLAELAEVGVETVRQIEKHQRNEERGEERGQKGHRPVSLAAVSAALGWPASALRAIADGADPPATVDSDEFRAEVIRRLDEFALLAADLQAAQDDLGQAVRELAAQREGRPVPSEERRSRRR